MIIPFIKPQIYQEGADCVYKQIMSGFIGPGKKIYELEEEIKQKFGVKHVIFTTSGTTALMIAALSLNLNKNDEIIIPAYGVICNANAFSFLGLKIKLVDINLENGSISFENLKKNISKKTKAICYVNFAGHLNYDLIKIQKLCKKKNLFLIEDNACGIGNKFGSKYAGTFGDVGTFSFSVAKNITCGQGGMLVFKKKKHYLKAQRLVDQGGNNWRKTNNHKYLGVNFRFNDILASYLDFQIKNLDKILKKKNKIYKLIFKNFEGRFYNFKTFTPLYNIIFVKNKKKIKKLFENYKIKTAIQYKTINQHSFYKCIDRQKEFPNANYWTKHALYLPSGLDIKLQEARLINKILNEFVVSKT